MNRFQQAWKPGVNRTAGADNTERQKGRQNCRSQNCRLKNRENTRLTACCVFNRPDLAKHIRFFDQAPLDPAAAEPQFADREPFEPVVPGQSPGGLAR